MTLEFAGNIVSIDKPNGTMKINVYDDEKNQYVLTISPVKKVDFRNSFVAPILRGAFMMSPSEVDKTYTIKDKDVQGHDIVIIIK